MFGGVYDEEENEEELTGTFFNELVALNLNKLQWHTVNLNGKNNSTRRRRRKEKDDDNEEEEEEEEIEAEPMEVVPEETTVTDDDGIFTVIKKFLF